MTAFQRGERALAQRRLDDALTAFSCALNEAKSLGERARALNKRGVAMIGLQRRSEAEEAFRAALELLPAHAPSLVNLGNLALEEGRIEVALARYDEAIKAAGDYAPAYHNKAAALKQAGRIAEAVRARRTATRLEITPPGNLRALFFREYSKR
ncbi:MAG TPA: tetratricopeptide repeat protein [Candidatus Baltobacteraceae bacterium]|nr:tetratricopeptide repeat protein [Candidatus Baltobacteraceae bacterium]